MFILFWDFLMVEQDFLSPEVKGSVFIKKSCSKSTAEKQDKIW